MSGSLLFFSGLVADSLPYRVDLAIECLPTGLPNEGSVVEVWTDTSGNNRHITQGDIAVAATTTVPNGIKAAGFVEGQSLNVPSLAALPAGHLFLLLKNGVAHAGDHAFMLAGVTTEATVFLPFQADHNIYDCTFSSIRRGPYGNNTVPTDYFLYEIVSTSAVWKAVINGTVVGEDFTNTVSMPTAGHLGKDMNGAWPGGNMVALAVYGAEVVNSNLVNVRNYFYGLRDRLNG